MVLPRFGQGGEEKALTETLASLSLSHTYTPALHMEGPSGKSLPQAPKRANHPPSPVLTELL